MLITVSPLELDELIGPLAEKCDLEQLLVTAVIPEEINEDL